MKKNKDIKDKGRRVNRNTLVEILSNFSFALDKKNISHSGEFIFFEDRVHVYNGEIYISCPFKLGMNFSVDGFILLKVLKSFIEKFVWMKINGSNLEIFSEQAKAKVSFVDIKDIAPSVIKDVKGFYLEKAKWEELPQSILEGLYLCGFSTSQDLTRGNLYCVNVEKNVVLSTDDLRLSRYVFKEELKGKKEKWLIPFNYVDLFSKYKFSNYCEFDTTWLSFKGEGEVIFALCKLKGTHLENVDSFFSMKKKNMEKIKFPNEMLSFLDLVVGLIDEDLDYDKIIKLVSKDGKMVFILDREFLYKERAFEIEEGKNIEFEFLVNPIFLKQILSRGSEFFFDKEKNHLHFYSDNFSHILSLYLKG